MPQRSAWAVAVLLLCGGPGIGEVPPPEQEAQSLSLIQLIANPERYEGRLVRVEGFGHFEFEESSLYLHREDADLLNSANGVWLDISKHDPKQFNETFVRVEGVFTAKGHGHLGAWPAEITNVRRLERARTRNDYRRMFAVPPSPRPSH